MTKLRKKSVEIGLTDGQMDGWTDVKMGGWTDGRMDG